MKREKERNLSQSNDKSPDTDWKIQKSKFTTQKRNQDFDCTTIADQLRTVIWGDDNHKIRVVKPVYGIPTFPLTATAQKTHI